MAQQSARVVSVNVGLPETFTLPDGETLTSGIRKRPVGETVRLGPFGLEGDGSHHESHGGPDRALHAFAADYYPWFEAQAGRPLPVPSFGENLTVEGHPDGVARVGDVIRVGTARVQITCPTERCPKPGRNAGVAQLLKWILESLHGGYCLRVLDPGEIRAGDRFELLKAGPEEWSVERLNRAMFREIHDEAQIVRLEALPELAPEWKARLRVHAERRARGA